MKKAIFFKENENLEVAESLRILRTNLSFLNEKNLGRTILFTSVAPNEGKSFLALNYAISISITGSKVLLIDCDLRKPRLHKSFSFKFDKGLESLFLGDSSLEEVIHKDVYKNLDIIPSKPIKNGVTELILKGRIKEILDTLKKEYHTIILDNPPIGIASDSVILSKFVDGIVLVVSYNQVSKRELEFAKKMLDNAGAHLYGFVVNKVNNKGLNYGSYEHYYHYYSYYNEYYDNNHIVKRKKSSNKLKHLFSKILNEYKKELFGRKDEHKHN